MKNAKFLSVFLALVLFIGLLPCNVSAAVSITVTPTEVYPGDTVNISASGANEDYYLAVYPPNAKDDQYIDYIYIGDLPADNIWRYTAPQNPNEYEVRLINGDNKSVGVPAAKFKVKLREASFKLSATSVTPEGKIRVTVGNVPETDAYSGTTVLLYKEGSKIDQYIAYKYISDLPSDNTWELNMPRELGKYYFAVHQNDSYEKPMGKSQTVEVIPFNPTITIDKLSYMIQEPIKIGFDAKTVPEFDFEIRICEAASKQDDYVTYKTKNSLPADNIYVAKLEKSGTYQARFFYSTNNGYLLFGTSKNFVVTDEGYIDPLKDASDWAKTEITDAQSQNLTTPNIMSDFQAPVTREEFCEMVIKLYEKMTGKKAEPAAQNAFNDTTNPEILKAYKLGIVNGVGNGNFAPKDCITREQIATMFLRCVKVAMPQINTTVANPPSFFDKSEVSSWAAEAIDFFSSKQIIKGSNGYFLPQANCTREAAIALVLRTFNEFSKI